MKKNYETPSVEIVEFRYSDQVVAKSGCDTQWLHKLATRETCEVINIGQVN